MLRTRLLAVILQIAIIIVIALLFFTPGSEPASALKTANKHAFAAAPSPAPAPSNSTTRLQEPLVIVAGVRGTITAGQLGYLRRQIDNAEKKGAQLFLIEMDTPGGLVDATIKINSAILNAPLPVAVLVAPAGAIAASAGSFIVLSADIAAMAPGTTIGAAQPVTLTPEGAESAGEKTTRFLAQHLRSLAREKGRPEDIAERFVTENLTLSAREALEAGVIDYLAADRAELLRLIDGLTVEKGGRTYTMDTAGAAVVEAEMNLRERFQNWLSDPQIAFLLLMLGVMGIYFGLSSPGTFIPEVIGGILLIMGIYGIGLFDTNTTGIILLFLGIGLIVAEIFTAGFGVLGVGGALSLVAGAILLPHEPLMGADWYGVFRFTAIGVAVAVAVISLLVFQRVVHSRRHSPTGSTLLGAPRRGVVVTEIPAAGTGMVRAHGELWQARSAEGAVIPPGIEVEVVRADTLTLYVRPARQDKESKE